MTRRGAPASPRGTSRAFEVVDEDDDIVVINKAAGVLTVPTQKRERFTVVDELSRRLSKGARITHPAWVVHRLDRDTTGLLVFAKHPRVRDALVARWDEHERIYAAIVAGEMRADRGTIESRLLTTRGLQRRSARDDEDGEDARTLFAVRDRMPGATLLDVTLTTGRRNQIRVHVAEAGHPILGDVRYGGLHRHALWDDRALALHARLLAFVHPRTGEMMRYEAPLPSTFTRFLERAHKPAPRARPRSRD